ncbi:UbiA family prenyltransferase [Ideonella sp.]|uniref:UbiA family prenyltransferase n=1 Tax=Ideonella sp. TaxID=1929293 RepID=UPI002B49E94B|nr:UbiA family prenyltransferase [Ideonella sp.]HJV72324.1 UbiA family prenyltransferase [Ideonella sp.]
MTLAVDLPPVTPARGALLAAAVPLVVDLDGTLLRTDTLLESLLDLARLHPADLLRVPLWLAQGRARLKHHLARRAPLDARTLPLAHDLLEHLRAQKRQGRRLILATGADAAVAHAMADELGLFDAVIASDGTTNLTATHKRDRLVAEFGERGFDYVGNSARDLPVWAAARRAVLVAPAPRVAAAARRVTEVERTFDAAPARAGTWLAAMRVHHWLKNLLLLVPLLAAHRLYEPAMLANAAIGGFAFCLAASGVYLLNDLLDLRADRRHPHKRERVLASGRMPIEHALALLPLLWLAAALLGAALPRPFLAALGTYVGLMLVYSVRLKDIAIVDAFALAAGYTLRILAGAIAVGMDVSPWLLVSSVALFFGLALLKRYAELVTLRGSLGPGARVRAYRVTDAALIAALGLAAGCVAVALLALYPVAVPSLHAGWPVWLVGGLLLFWTGHMWLMAHRGRIRDDPVVFALRDPLSRVFGLLTAAVLVLSA